MKKERVFVGLSGGVDSGTAAALLKERGYDVTGVFIRIWRPAFLECTWQEDRLDAMRVAAYLEIPFREIDLSEEYEREVVQRMVGDYQAGITPNPDVLCNEKVKFGAFLKWALKNGAEKVATGHYARVAPSRASALGTEHPLDVYDLLRGVDPAKDQSYFLYRLGQAELAASLFPIGEYRKEDVRRIAARFGLPVASKPDSQGLCFVGDVSMPEFLKRFIDVPAGDVLDMAGNRIGRHDGAALYTVGQRHGFTVEGKRGRESHYVVRIDAAANTLIVSVDRNDALASSATIPAPQWIGAIPQDGARASVQTRYHAPLAQATLRYKKDAVILSFDTSQLVSPGQAIVLYDGGRCLGGGVAA